MNPFELIGSFDAGAALQKLGGNQAADVFRGYNALRADNPNNPWHTFSPYFQKEPGAPAQPKNDSPGGPEAQNQAWTPSSASSNYGGGYSTQQQYNPADLAYLDDQEARLRRQQQSAGTALTNGLTQLTDSYNQERDSANKNQSRALQDVAVKREDTTRAKDTALNRVDTNARTLADSLRRRIGMASGSGSSAYQITAPGAVARQASEQRGGVQESYGTNFRNLDTAENRMKVDFEDLLRDLDSQRRTRESDFRAGILDRQNQIDSALAEVARQRALARGGGYDQVRSAMAPLSAQIDARQGEIDSLFDRFRNPYTVRNVDTSIPTLSDYTVDRAKISADQVRDADPTNPLRRRLDEESLY